MSLNPSNLIAQRTNPEARTFPNLARGHKAKPEDYPEVDETVRKELAEAGIEVSDYRNFEQGEVPTSFYSGNAHRWQFRRAWYYYVAKGDGIPAYKAEEFHKKWGTQVRVAGHCGCPSPLEWYEGFAVDCYHIDTQEGLNAFVALLATIHKPRKEESKLEAVSNAE